MLRKTLVKWQDGTYDNEALLPHEKCGGEHYREVITKKSYVDYAADRGLGDSETESHESWAANPDIAESTFDFGVGEAQPRASRIIMDQAIKQLTPKQREIWRLCMSATKAKSVTEAAAILKLDHSTVSRQLAAATRAVTKFCEAHQDLIKEDGQGVSECDESSGL